MNEFVLVQSRQALGHAACGRDLPKPALILGLKSDGVVVSPACAVAECKRRSVAEGHHRSSANRNLFQLPGGMEADPLAVRREEGGRGAFGSGNRLGLESVNGSQIKLLDGVMDRHIREQFSVRGKRQS